MAVAGQMMAGTTEKLMPIIAVEIHRLKCVVPSNRNVRLNSSVPKVSSSAVSEPVGDEAEERRCENRREQDPTVGKARFLQRQALRILEILDREGASKGKEHRCVQQSR
jgi:hypothetical protein